jgi:hypothetical protein
MAVSVAESAAETRRWLYKECVPGFPWGRATPHLNETIHDMLASESNAVTIPSTTGSKRKYILTQAPWQSPEVLPDEIALHFQHYQKTKSKFPDLIFKELRAVTFEVVRSALFNPELMELKEQGGTRSVIVRFETIQENTWGQLTDQISTMLRLFDVKICIDGEACNKRCKVKSYQARISRSLMQQIPLEDTPAPSPAA